MVSPINEAFIQFQRRADAADPAKLVSTFVDVGPLFTLLSSTDHQIIYGRRGTGKTHALHFLAQQRRTARDIAIYIDMRTVGSAGNIYSDPERPLSERASKLIFDVISAIHDELLQFSVDNSEECNLAVLGPILDNLLEAVRGTHVVGDTDVREESKHQADIGSSTAVRVGAGLSGVSISGAVGSKESRSLTAVRETKFRQSPIATVVFGPIEKFVSEFARAIEPKRIWILVDEWSVVPTDLQPYLADILRRTLMPVRGVVLKLAAIEHRSSFQLKKSSGDYVGIEIGADITADIYLDDFMVFDNDPNRARDFFRS